MLKQEQSKFFSKEINVLNRVSQVKSSSKIIKLYPFLHDGVLCVGGRLVHSNLPDETKYQRIVPKESELARLIVNEAHRITLHGGTNQVVSQIRTQFWIPGCRSLVRKLILNCVTCSRFSAKPFTPLIGDLPKERIDIPERAFEHVGLDYGGPFFCMKSVYGSEKVYMALFALPAKRCILKWFLI